MPLAAAIAQPVAATSTFDPASLARAQGPIIAAGFVLGGFIGYLMRPSVILVGQLPFSMVISRGANLEGLDQLLVPAARESFNGMLAGAIVGLLIALGLARLLPKPKP